MESYIRPGCVVLSVYTSMTSVAWDEVRTILELVDPLSFPLIKGDLACILLCSLKMDSISVSTYYFKVQSLTFGEKGGFWSAQVNN